MFFITFLRNGILTNLREDVYKKIIGMPISYFTDKKKGDVISRITADVLEIQHSFLSILELIVREPLTIFFTITAMFLISFKLTAFVLIFIPLSGFIISLIGRSLKATSTLVQNEQAEFLSITEETLNGLKIIEEISKKKKDTVNILTHCNAGWLATIDWGTATSPIYHAHQKGIKVHVWVDETRPRNQGANLTSYELNEEGIPNTIIADNTGGILMQRGQVDMCIVGTDRTLANGDVCNKIGTYLKALAAKDNNVPFYVALPSSTIDWKIKEAKDIPIEERNSEELSHIEGVNKKGEIEKFLIYPKKSKTLNLAFDITPAKYVTGLITERGICDASKEGLQKLFK